MRKIIDITGKRFGRLTAISQLSRDRANELGLRRGAHWICKCDCGKTRIASCWRLRAGDVTACADCNPKRLNVAGERYGMLVALRLDKVDKQGAYWLFACDCGRQATLRLKDVRYGNTLSCGCLKKAKGYRHGAPKLMTSRPWRDTPTTFAKSFEAECASVRIEVAP